MTTTEILDDAKKRSGFSEDDIVLLRWANQGYQYRNLRIARAIPSYFLTSDTLSIVAGTDIYNLPATFLRSLRIEDENGDEVDQVDPNDPNEPDGWYFYGSVIESGVRYERIRVQVGGGKPTATVTWTVHFVESPGNLDLTTNTVPNWPTGVHELPVLEILCRWMEAKEIPERLQEYRSMRKDMLLEFEDLLGDRSAGRPNGPIILSPEDFD